MSGEFCDTNILVYAYDSTAGAKRERAQRLLERLWQTGDGVVSVQVLQELFVTVTRKVAHPLPTEEARAVVADMAAWQVVAPDAADVLEAIDGTLRWQVTFWDAMLLVAAKRAEVAVLWSEDLNDGQVYDGVSVRNPFRPDADIG